MFYNTFTINGQVTDWSGNGLVRTCLFTATGTGGGFETLVYSATVDDITFDSARLGYSDITAQNVKITNTGNRDLQLDATAVSLTGASAGDFTLGINYVPTVISVGVTNDTAWYIKPKDGLSIGTHTATIEFRNIENKMSAPATATVTFEVMDHNFDTSTWNHDESTHWNPCTDSGCTARGNEAPHNSDVLKNATVATFDADGYTGDGYCSVCDIKVASGSAISAGKYIRESKATMTPAALTDALCADDLQFVSFDTSKYNVEFLEYSI